MARTLEMIFDAKLRNAGDVEKFEATIENVAKTTGITAGNLRLFNSVLTETAQRTGSYTAAVRDLAGQSNIFQQFAKQIQSTLNEQNKATQDAANAAKKAASDFEKAKAAEVRAAQKAADAIIAQHKRVQQALGRAGTRVGGMALGSAIGAPGLGYAGSMLASGIGLSGGAMAAVGGVGAALFAGVEFAKSLDNLAKWAQEQKNAAAETGITVSEMQELSRVADRTGVNISGAAKSVQDLSKEMVQGGGRAREIQSALSELGLKSSVAFEEPYKGLTDIQKGLAAIKDPIERDRVAIELLGEAAGRAAAATAGIAGSKNIIDPQTIATLVNAREQMEQIGEKWDLLKAMFASPLNATLTFIVGVAGGKGAPFSLKDNPGASLNGVPLVAGSGATSWLLQNWDSGPDSKGIISHLSNPGAPGALKNSVGPYPFTLQDPSQRAADEAYARNQHAQAWLTGHGTPEDQYRSTDESIRSDQKRIWDQYQSKKLTDQQFDSQMSGIEARKAAAASARKSTEEYRSQVENFQREVIAPVDSSDTLRQLGQLPKRYNLLGGYGPYQDWIHQLGAHAKGAMQQIGSDMISRQFPGLATGDYSKLYSPTGKENEEFQHGLERGVRNAQGSQEQIQRDQRQRLDDITSGMRDTTEDNNAALRLRTAITSGARGALSRNGGLSSTGIAQLDLADTMRLIQQSYTASAGPITSAIGQQTGELGLATTPDQQQAIQRQIDNEKAQLQKLQNDRLTQSVDALNKFNESVDQASNKLKDEFGSFASGLVSAARTGHAGTYARNFGFGQFDKVVDNFAKSVYQPGMLSVPGQGSPTDPTFLGKLLQGTMFAQDPKAHAETATKDNTVATLDNTTALLAVYAALGGDPGALSVSSGSTAAIPFFGSGASAASPVLGQVAAVAKSLGISLPGVSSAPGGSSGSSIGGPIGSILKLFGIGGGSGASSSGGGFNFSTAGIASSVGDTGSVIAPDGSISFPALGVGSADASALSFPALGIGAQAQSSTAPSPQAVRAGGAAASGATWSPFTTGTASSGQLISAGVGTAGAAFGVYQGAATLAKGGGRNIAAGIGTIAGSAAALDPEPISKGILAGVALVSGIVGSLMGDPRAARQKQLTEEQIANTYTAPNPLNVTTNASGMMTTTDYRGNVESLDARPSVSSVNALLGFDPYNTSHVLSSSQWQLTPSGMVPPTSKTTAPSQPVQVTQHISTMDSKSFMDHGPQFADALVPVLQGTHRISAEIQRVIHP